MDGGIDGVSEEHVKWFEKSFTNYKEINSNVKAALYFNMPIPEIKYARVEQTIYGNFNVIPKTSKQAGLYETAKRLGNVNAIYFGKDAGNDFIYKEDGTVIGYCPVASKKVSPTNQFYGFRTTHFNINGDNSKELVTYKYLTTDVMGRTVKKIDNEDGVNYRAESPVELKFREDGTFRILQLTDTHVCDLAVTAIDENTGETVTRSFKPDSLNNIRTMIQKEKANGGIDLAVLTGDIIFGLYAKDIDNISLIQEVIDIFEEEKVYFAYTFGNHEHDNVFKYSILQYYEAVKKSPYFVGFDGEIDSELQPYLPNLPANYSLDIKSHDGTKTVWKLFLFDNGPGFSTNSGSRFGAYYTTIINKAKKANPDVRAMAFMHVPMTEFSSSYSNPEERVAGIAVDGYGSRDDASVYRAFKDSKVMKLVGVGHYHRNNYITFENKDGIAQAFGQTGDYVAYNFRPAVDPLMERGGRIIELRENEIGKYATYVRYTRTDEVFNQIDWDYWNDK